MPHNLYPRILGCCIYFGKSDILLVEFVEGDSQDKKTALGSFSMADGIILFETMVGRGKYWVRTEICL